MDADGDRNLSCADCDDASTTLNVCACEACTNMIDDDCDAATDVADADSVSYPVCIGVAAGAEPALTVVAGACVGAAVGGPYDVIRGQVGQLQFSAGHVDLGSVECVAGALPWDHVTDASARPNPLCDPNAAVFFVAKNTPDPDYGAAATGERRDVMTPDPACP